jgi:tetratricopeptide (TPR) repeat protein
MTPIDIEQKIQDYLEQLETNAESAEIYASLSSLYAQKQLWQEAVIASEKAIALNPKFAGAYRNLARIFTQLGQKEAATECWFQAYSLEPTWAGAEEFDRLGNLLLEQKQLERASVCYIHAIQFKQDFAEAYWHLGIVLTQQGKYAEATESYRWAIEHSLHGSDLQKQIFDSYSTSLTINTNTKAIEFYELAKLLRSKSFFGEAVDAYQQALQLSPLFAVAHSDLSYTMIPKDRLGSLIDLYEQITANHPSLAIAWSNLGGFLAQQGQQERSIVCYQKSCYYQTIQNRPYLVAWLWQKPKNPAPSFIIAGATKCGTTSLYRYLDGHPQILLSHKKEINFFHQHFDRGKEWYLAQFPFLEDPQFVTGEASPNYFDFPRAAQNMHQLFPQIKLIILLRNPIEKAVSWHYHKIKMGLEKRSLRESIEGEIESLAALSEKQIIQSGYRHPNNILGSLYYYKLQLWLKLFSPEQLLILKSEDFYQNTPKIMTEVYQFLGLPAHKSQQYLVWNSGSYTAIEPELRAILAEYFQPYNQRLEECLGRKFDWH